MLNQLHNVSIRSYSLNFLLYKNYRHVWCRILLSYYLLMGDINWSDNQKVNQNYYKHIKVTLKVYCGFGIVANN